jgi:hypothetical protein
VQLLEKLRSEMAQATPDREQTLKAGVSTADKENPVALQVDEAKSKIAEMNAALAIAKERGDQVSIDKLTAGLAKAGEALSNLQFGPVLERMRTQMEQLAATWDGTQSGLLTKQLQVAQATLASTQSNSKEHLSVVQEEARLEVQQRQAAGSELIASARAQIAEISGETGKGAIQRLEAERDVWASVLAGDRLTASQRAEVQRSFGADVASIARERQTQAQAIARSDANTDVAISRLALEAKKSELDAEVGATKQSVAQKYAVLKTLADQEFALDLQALNNELATLPQESAAYEETYNKIRELKAKLVAELAGLNRQETEAAKQAAKEQASDWKGVVGEIESSESGLVSDLLTKRKSLSASLVSISTEMVTKEIANDLRAFTTKLLLQDQQKAMEQGGLLYHEMVNLIGTNSTVQSQSAQTAAVTTGNAARIASTQAAAVASKGAGAATGGATVMADAAKAFSGTYASVAQIPYVGWILAPAAAAAAFAAVAGYEGLASLDVGTNYVPQDMVARIHKGEAVVPKAYNPAAGGSGGGGGGDTHNYGGTINVTDSSIKRMLSSRGSQRAVMDVMAGAYRRGARPR